MTHCEKCISYDMCNYEYEHQDTDAILTFFPNNTDCPWFKNKADFVEVVRCKKCKYGEVSIFSKSKDGQKKEACYCNLKNMVTDVDDYCSGGERRNT